MASRHISAWLFPGQGSQYLGMGRDLWAQSPRAVEIVEEAEAVSGFPLRKISLQGPDEELKRTDALQPAITAVALGCCALLEEKGFQPDMVAGHSLGEFAALYAGGVISLSDCLKLVTGRGRLMQQVASTLNGGMGAVKRLKVPQLRQLISETDPEICIANFNAAEQLVVAGSLSALEKLRPKVSAAGGDYVQLPVAGPWHNHSMASAASAFAAVVDAVEFSAPRCPVFMNVTGAAETDETKIKDLVRVQMTSSVFWQTTVEAMFARGATLYLEVGPGKVLRGLMRRILPDESLYRIRGIENKRSLEFLAAEAAA